MAKGEGSPGTARLARALSERMKKYADDITQDLKVDFGVIQNDWSLLTNSFPKPIPKGQYHVCYSVTGDSTESAGREIHKHKLRKLKKGDHVLMVWVQNEPVVIDKVVSSSSL